MQWKLEVIRHCTPGLEMGRTLGKNYAWWTLLPFLFINSLQKSPLTHTFKSSWVRNNCQPMRLAWAPCFSSLLFAEDALTEHKASFTSYIDLFWIIHPATSGQVAAVEHHPNSLGQGVRRKISYSIDTPGRNWGQQNIISYDQVARHTAGGKMPQSL